MSCEKLGRFRTLLKGFFGGFFVVVSVAVFGFWHLAENGMADVRTEEECTVGKV
jgi:hypothetical protein